MTCETCNDVGRVQVSGTKQIASGTYHTTEPVLCPCRADEPRRHGDARWWTSMHIHEDIVEVLCTHVTVIADLEVPVSADNHRLIRDRRNVYYPAGVFIETGDDEIMLMTYQALRLGWSIIAAAHRAMGADSVTAFDRHIADGAER